MKRIFINSSYNDELRVAFVEGAKLFDLDTELVEKTFTKEVLLRQEFQG